MKNRDLTCTYWFSHGWSTLKKNLKLMILGGMIYHCSYIIPALLFHLPFGSYLARTFQFVIYPVWAAGWAFFCLKLVRGQSVRLQDIFRGFYCFAKVWATSFLTTLIILLGFVLFFIPGIIALLKYGLSMYVVMDMGLAPHKAISYSGRITKGHIIKLSALLIMIPVTIALTWPFGFGLQNIRTNEGLYYMAIGIIPYLLGFWIVIPLTTAVWATAYDVLSKQYDEN